MSKNKRLIAKIMDGNTVVMTVDQNLLSAEFGALDRGSLTDVTDCGIYVNRGLLSFVDNTGFFNNQSVNSPTILGLIVKFYLVDRNSEHIIGTFNILSATINEFTREVTVECISKLEQLQKLELPEYYPFDSTKIYSFVTEANSHLEKTTVGEIKIGGDNARINNTEIYCPYFGKETAWQRLNKICEASMSRIYDDEYGSAVISGSYPSRSPIIVNPSNILDVQFGGFVRVPNASLEVTNREKRVKTNRLIENIGDNFTLDYNENGHPIYEARTNANISGGTFYFYGQGVSGDGIFVKFFKTTASIYKIKDNPDAKVFITLEENPDPSTEFVGSPTSLEWVKEITIKNPGEFYYEHHTTAVDAIGSKWITHIKFIRVEFYADHFRDVETETQQIITSTGKDVVEIPSNDLIQVDSRYDAEPLGENILQEVVHRYGQGIECFEIECLFNDYFYEDGSKAFDGQDLSNHFKKYDVIIPYIVRRGQTVPLRANADGTPKKFRIIGISYLYDGLLRQKLQVQEERYDV